jgi:superfamily II DNA or RNA helicase
VSTNEKWTLLVPKRPLFKTWNDEMIKWNYLDFGKDLQMFCYASAHKLENNDGAEGMNIILDEAHRVTDRNLPYIKSMLGTKGKLICLSATVPSDKKDLLQSLGILPSHIVSYSLDTAVEDNLVSNYKIQVIQFPLNSTDKNIEAGKKGSKFMVTEQQGYQFADQRARQSLYSANAETKKFMMLARMRFIYNLPSKLQLTSFILSQIPADKKVIVFCGSILQANAVCKHRYHSKTDESDYEAFCAGTIHQIAVVQSVAEGVNIPNVDYAILMQVQSSDLHTIQKIGRALRKTDDPTKCSKIIVLEALGTQDSKWVSSALESFDPAKIDYVSSTQLQTKGLSL